jgi:putative methyltransferase
MKAAGATHVEPILLDFLKSDPSDDRFSQVQAMVVDPSCSGSGMAARADHLLTDDSTNDPARVKKVRCLLFWRAFNLLYSGKTGKLL